MGMGPDAEVDYVANLAPMMSSAKMDWRTPRAVLDRVCRLGPIGLDPCPSPDAANWIAEVNTPWPEYDGLTADWAVVYGSAYQPGPVFVNPPYGRALAAWMGKCAEEAARGREIIGLVPARPDTRWFKHCWSANAICFWRGRIKFETDSGPMAPAPFPSALPYWGPRVSLFRAAFADAGHVVVRTP